MTQEELNRLMQELINILAAIKIPVSKKINPQVKINSRAKRRLGCCYYKNGEYEIEVSQSLLEKPEKLRETMCHELLHTCRGCRNHGELWKSYAKTVSEALNMDIQRLSPADEETARLRNDEIKYALICESCGKKIFRCRASKVIKQPWRYRCICGGRLRVEKL